MKLRIGAAVFEVASFAEASAVWCKTRDENGWGGSDSPPVTLRDGKTPYYVSYNGRVWSGHPSEWTSGATPVYEPPRAPERPKCAGSGRAVQPAETFADERTVRVAKCRECGKAIATRSLATEKEWKGGIDGPLVLSEHAPAERVVFKEYPEIEFPAFLRERGFTDYSYHHDACARAEKVVAGVEGKKSEVLRAWVEYDDAERREFYGDARPTKFAVYRVRYEDDGSEEQVGDALYLGESAEECAKAIDEAWRTTLKVGTRVRFKPGTSKVITNFEIDIGGKAGAVVYNDGQYFSVRLDEHNDVLDGWENEVTYSSDPYSLDAPETEIQLALQQIELEGA